MPHFGELSKETVRDLQPPEQQPDAVLNQDNPISGTKYTVLTTQKNVRIISIMVIVTWTVQPTPLEIHATIDGVTYRWSIEDPVSASYYMCPLDPRFSETNQLLTAAAPLSSAFLLEGRSVKVEAETTGGTVSNLTARVKWAKW